MQLNPFMDWLIRTNKLWFWCLPTPMIFCFRSQSHHWPSVRNMARVKSERALHNIKSGSTLDSIGELAAQQWWKSGSKLLMAFLRVGPPSKNSHLIRLIPLDCHDIHQRIVFIITTTFVYTGRSSGIRVTENHTASVRRYITINCVTTIVIHKSIL